MTEVNQYDLRCTGCMDGLGWDVYAAGIRSILARFDTQGSVLGQYLPGGVRPETALLNAEQAMAAAIGERADKDGIIDLLAGIGAVRATLEGDVERIRTVDCADAAAGRPHEGCPRLRMLAEAALHFARDAQTIGGPPN